MDTAGFLSFFWKGDWNNCLGRINGQNIRHYWSPSEYSSFKNQENIYFAPATFETEIRKQKFAVGANSLWLDVDVGGEEGKYHTIREAIAGLREFTISNALPSPMLVQSGAGVHVYFMMDDMVVTSVWESMAAKLRRLCEEHGLLVDHHRTEDIASFMRLPNTVNVKLGRPKLPVLFIKDSFEAISPQALDKLLTKNFNGVVKPEKKESVLVRANRTLEIENLVSSQGNYDANQIAAGCPQLATVRAKRGNVSEPVWYHALQVLRFVENSRDVSHQWSNGHPEYSPEETDAKLEQLAEKDIGPTLCSTFEQDGDASLCRACQHYHKITTPLVLGRKVIDLEVTPVELIKKFRDEIKIPRPYALDADGQVVLVDRSGLTTIIHKHTLYVSARYRESDAQYYYQLVADTPADGVKRLRLSTETLYSKRSLYTELANAAIFNADMLSESAQLLHAYIFHCVEQFFAENEALHLYSAFGWSDDYERFHLGECMYTKKEIASAVYRDEDNHTLPAKSARSEPWEKVFRHYLEAPVSYRLAFFSSLAAPLVYMTGLHGVIYSLFSRESGIGKTTALKAGAAIWGNPDRLMAKKSDTMNSLLNMAGRYRSLPLYVDEFSVADERSLATFVYDMANGREKNRLTEDIQVREGGAWDTFIVASTNSSLISRVGMSPNREGITARLVELETSYYASSEVLREINDIAGQHYGVVGPQWAQHIVKHQERIQQSVREALHKVNGRFKIEGSTRFYAAFITTIAIAMKEASALWGIPDAAARTVQEFMKVVVPGGVGLDVAAHAVPGDTQAAVRLQQMRKTFVDELAVAMEKVGVGIAYPSKIKGGAPIMPTNQQVRAVIINNNKIAILESILRSVPMVVDRFERVGITAAGQVVEDGAFGSMAARVITGFGGLSVLKKGNDYGNAEIDTSTG